MGSISDKHHDQLQDERLNALLETLENEIERFLYQLEVYGDNPEPNEIKLQDTLWLLKNREEIIKHKSFINQLIPNASRNNI